MKNKTALLNVDVVGGQGSLTKEEEMLISEFIQSEKAAKTKRNRSKGKSGVTKV